MLTTKFKKAVILVGHGGIPTDCPNELVQKFMILHKKRTSNDLPPTILEMELEEDIRNWPRTPETDPYKAGLELLASQLEPLLENWTLRTAYNEFCSPSIEKEVKRLVEDGVDEILLVTTMLTPGGSHSEKEIPAEVTKLRDQFTNIEINYAWPFDLENVAKLLANHVKSFSKTIVK